MSQPTVSRRWDRLRPLIGQVLAEFTPYPAQVVELEGHPRLFSGKAGYAGMIFFSTYE